VGVIGQGLEPNKSNKSLRLDKCHAEGLAVFGRRPSSAEKKSEKRQKREGGGRKRRAKGEGKKSEKRAKGEGK
jgi:hypothetical protein